jgi:hypothetical protein
MVAWNLIHYSCDCTGCYSSVHATLLSGYMKLQWRWATANTHKTFIQCILYFCDFVWEHVFILFPCSLSEMELYFYILSLYMYIQVRLPFLNSAVWTSWQRMVFPKIFCLCGLFCISIPRQNPELKQRSADMWMTLQEKTNNIRMHGSSVLWITLAAAVLVHEWWWWNLQLCQSCCTLLLPNQLIVGMWQSG